MAASNCNRSGDGAARVRRGNSSARHIDSVAFGAEVTPVKAGGVLTGLGGGGDAVAGMPRLSTLAAIVPPTCGESTFFVAGGAGDVRREGAGILAGDALRGCGCVVGSFEAPGRGVSLAALAIAGADSRARLFLKARWFSEAR